MMMVYHSTYICTFKAQNSVVLFQKHCYFYITIVVPFTYTGLGGNPKFKLVTKKMERNPKSISTPIHMSSVHHLTNNITLRLK